MLSKGARYYADFEAVREPAEYGRSQSRNGESLYSYVRRMDDRDGRNPAPSSTKSGTGGSRNPRNYAILDDPGLSDDDFAALADAVAAAQAAYDHAPRPPDWVQLSPEPSKRAHYASYGPKAILPFLKLATSERGCCADCGAAWGRVTEANGKAVSGHSRGNG